MPIGLPMLTMSGITPWRWKPHIWLPVRPVGRRLWPNGTITHEELRPLKMLASRMPCPYLNPGRYVGVAPGEEVSDEDFKAQLQTLNEELETLNAQARTLEQTIAANVAGILEA